MNCSNCHSELPAGKAQCTSCKTWNVVDIEDLGDQTVTLDKVKSAEADRIKIGDWGLVWGGGIVKTSVTLLGGAPGAGKSTLLLQLSDLIVESEKHQVRKEILYIATEEALEEIKLRADRLNIKNLQYIRMAPAMGGGLDLAKIMANREPVAVIIDSLQGFAGDNLIGQVHICETAKKAAVMLNAPFILISHVTKDGELAGLNDLQHAVDTTMTFFPDETGIRMLEVTKNRFGRAFVHLVCEMGEHGLSILEETEDETEDSDDG
jgi:DNA repair protein RadA/Sms